MDAERIKNEQRTVWKTSSTGWKKHDELIMKGARPVAERLLELVALREGHRVLDIASGTGEPALSAAERVGASGFVLGTDLVDEMLEVAREKAKARGYAHVEFQMADGEELGVEPGTFDAVTCRWGLMFMPDPVGCMRKAHQALKPGGRIAVATWADAERNPFASLPMGVLMKHADVPKPPPGAPGMFALSERARLASVLEEAGFSDVEIGEVPLDIIDVESGQAYWSVMREVSGPIMRFINGLEEGIQTRVHREIETTADQFHDGTSVKLKGVSLVASGTR